MEGNKYDKEEDSKVEITAEVSKEQLRDELKTNSDDNTNNERNSVKINLLSERNNYKFPIVLINDYFQSSTESDDKGASRNFERVTIKPSKNNNNEINNSSHLIHQGYLGLAFFSYFELI